MKKDFLKRFYCQKTNPKHRMKKKIPSQEDLRGDQTNKETILKPKKSELLRLFMEINHLNPLFLEKHEESTSISEDVLFYSY